MTIKCSDIGDDQDMLVVVALDIVLNAAELTEFEVVEEDLLSCPFVKSATRGNLNVFATTASVGALCRARLSRFMKHLRLDSPSI